MDPYKDGRKARRLESPAYLNPHPSTTPEHKLWEKGWRFEDKLRRETKKRWE